jgi:hypothetical protein
MKAPEFVIWSRPWDENSGGIIVLHTLCARLNELGYSAALWPSWQPALLPKNWKTLRNWAGYRLKGRFLRRFDTGPFRPRLSKWRDLKHAVVIYPEIVSGNPLGGRKVARWLLYHPAAHSGVADYGSHDLIVAYNAAFAPSDLPADHILYVTYQNPSYHQWNFGQRTGSCVLLRKGAGRLQNAHPPDSVVVDDLAHEDRAAVFNRVRFCYSYDLYTYYTVYAALCGCTPVIVPQPGLSEQEWQPQESNRLGLAYGEQKIPWAEATRQQLRDHIAERREIEDATVAAFVKKARDKTNW